jgi:glycosyltransferase involved in cell wall biosynthesis
MTPRVVYVVPAAMGGMLNIVAHLLAHRRPDGLGHRAILTVNPLLTDTLFTGTLAAPSERFVHSMPRENLYSVLRRLARRVGRGPGVLVANDWIELAMLWRHDPGTAVVQILHGDHDYYYDLARRNERVVDVFVAYSQRMAERLRETIPHRAADVLHLPYGIPLPPRVRPAGRTGPLRLVFAGRLEHGQKGVFDLPEIAAELERRGIEAEWTVVGGGPDEAALRRRWPDPRVTWAGVLDNAVLVERLADFDVFVLPTRAEGFPVALLEAQGAGLVPVVSDLESGVPEVVISGATGFRPPVGDIAGFAEAIATLAADRAKLDAMGQAGRAAVERDYRVEDRTAAFQALYARWAELRRPRTEVVGRPPYGSRLDQPWLPNALVKGIRWGLRRVGRGR